MSATDRSSTDDKELLYAIEGAERYRTRARSVATITATGAGALAAGLVLNSTSSFSLFSKLLGLLSIILLLFATAVFVIASLVHSRTAETNKGNWFGIFLRPWETLYSPQSDANESGLMRQSDAVLTRILKAMDAGMWLAGAAVAALVVALVSISVLPPPRQSVEITFVGDRAQYEKCPDLPQSFSASALKSDLEKEAKSLLVKVAPETCGRNNREEVSLFLNREKLQIVLGKSLP
ncbi:hypothetical protein [Pseudarthrobacter sp. C4D7]|uniref:hypothetical protein n=1 Tax=Pseudarthrobacter sp. C4D7 TaxID=2735268 RepID=UPI0015854B7C|nr:hypothetical protein [Pseudarthrobacter sp. C4D7]NUT70416.1 hypothetical protein [Pseudarthrobacter sp. C4D7]